MERGGGWLSLYMQYVFDMAHWSMHKTRDDNSDFSAQTTEQTVASPSLHSIVSLHAHMMSAQWSNPFS